MTNEIGEAFVRIRPNMSSFETETVSGVKKTFKRVAEIAGIGYGAKTLFDFGKKAAEDAAYVQKSQELIKSEFGKSGQAIKDWSENAGIHLGIAAHESDSVAARFGILFANMGIGKAQAANMTLNLEKLGGSIAAIRGIDPATVFERLPIALAGNVRGLKQLGISIDANAIKQEALKLGFGHVVGGANASRIAQEKLAIAQAEYAHAISKYGEGTTQAASAHIRLEAAQAKVSAGAKVALSALTPAQRAMVIYSIATKNLGDYQQQAAKHSGDFSNVQRRLTAQWDQARETLGKDLLPQLTKYGTELSNYIDKADKSGKLQKTINTLVNGAVTIFKDGARAIELMWKAGQKLSDMFGGLKHTAEIFFAVIAVNKIRAITAAIQTSLIESGFKQLGIAVQAEKNAYIAAFGEMEIATIGLSAEMKAALISTGIGAIVVAISIGTVEIINHWNTVKRWLEDFGKWIWNHWWIVSFFPVVGQTVYVVGQIVKHWGDFKDFISGVGKFFGTVFTHPIRATEEAFQGIVNYLEKQFKGLVSTVGSILAKIPSWMPGVGKFHDWGVQMQDWAATTGTSTGQAFGNNFSDALVNAVNGAIAKLPGKASKLPGKNDPGMSIQGAVGASAIKQALLRGGASPGEASFLTAISGREDPSGGLGVINNNPKTGDYSVGLFQINYFKKLMAERTRKYGSPAQLANSLQLQVKAALDILRHGGGPGAWSTNTPAIQALLGGGTSSTSRTGSISGGDTGPLTVGTIAKSVKLSAVQIANAKRSLDQTFAGIKDTISKNGGAINAKIRADMADARKDISDVATTADISKARSQLTTLRREVSDHMALLKQRIALNNTFGGLKTQAANLGPDITPGITASMTKIREEIAKAVTPQTVARVRAQMAALKTAISTQAEAIKQQADQIRTAFEGAFGRVASAADSAFDKATAKALKSMQTLVSVGGASFLFGGSVTQTPAEKALATLQSSHQAALDAKTLSDAQDGLAAAQASLAALMNPTQDVIDKAKVDYNSLTARLAAAQSKLDSMQADPKKFAADQVAVQSALVAQLQNSADAKQQALTDLLAPTDDTVASAKQAVVDAQATLDDAKFNQQQTALQAQAQIEQDAAQQQLQDAQDAYAAQRDLLKTSLDDRVSAIEIGMENGTIATKEGMDKLTALFADPQYGIDVTNSALVIAGAFYTGLDNGLKPVFDLFDKLAAKMRELGLLPNGDKTPGPPGAKNPVQLPGGITAPATGTIDDIAAALALANKPTVDELQKQTNLLAGKGNQQTGRSIAVEIAR